jgi:hypothetical protein
VSTQPKIKVIKRVERERRKQGLDTSEPIPPVLSEEEKTEDAARTIAGWIGRLREQKHESSILARKLQKLEFPELKTK